MSGKTLDDVIYKESFFDLFMRMVQTAAIVRDIQGGRSIAHHVVAEAVDYWNNNNIMSTYEKDDLGVIVDRYLNLQYKKRGEEK